MLKEVLFFKNIVKFLTFCDTGKLPTKTTVARKNLVTVFCDSYIKLNIQVSFSFLWYS